MAAMRTYEETMPSSRSNNPYAHPPLDRDSKDSKVDLPFEPV